jgi:acyl dehydratase
MTTTTSFNTDALGQWTEEVPFTVEKERAIAYAKATNDENARHLSGELAPPVFAVVPIWNTLGPSILGVVPAEILPTVLHGEQDIFIHEPIRPGMELISRAKPVGIHAAGSGVSVNTFTETRTTEGGIVNEQWMTSFFRGAEFDGDTGKSAPSHRVDPADRSAEPIATVEQGYDKDQTFRYSEASGDLMPIHLDDDIAKQVGLPGIIIHGLCTMAFNSRAVIAEAAEGEPERLKRLAVRFSKTAFPEQKLTTSIYSAPDSNGNAAVAFESETDAGIVIKDGLAEIAE